MYSGDQPIEITPAISKDLAEAMASFDTARQPVEFVAAAPDRQPAGEIAGHDALGGAGHGVDPVQHPPRHEDAAAEAEHDDDQQRPLRGLGNKESEQPTSFIEIASDQQAETIAEFRDAHERAVIGGILLVEPAVRRLGPANRGHHTRGQ